MGTKRAFEDDLQEFFKHPKHLDYDSKPVTGTETKLPLETVQMVGLAGENGNSVPGMVVKELEISAPLPLVTGIEATEDDYGPGPVFPPNLFSEVFGYNFPRRPLFNYEDIYSSLLNRSPRKEIPIGPNHQADVPEFDPEVARRYGEVGEMGRYLGVCVIPFQHTFFESSSNHQTDCKCPDHGSVRCVQQHVKEARMKLKEGCGDEKFVELGLRDMGEEVADRWSEEEERLFYNVVYSNPASGGRMFWKELSVALPCRGKKEVVSYYFNVFILWRRAVQNRTRYLDIDSDDDEWHGCYGGEGDDFVVGDDDPSSVEGDEIEGDATSGIDDVEKMVVTENH